MEVQRCCCMVEALRILETIKCLKQWQGTVSPFLQANVTSRIKISFPPQTLVELVGKYVRIGV